MPNQEKKFEIKIEKFPEIKSAAMEQKRKEAEEKLERKKRLCKEAELTIVLPLFKKLITAGILSYAGHSAEKADRELGVDFIWGFENGFHLAVQFSAAESWKIRGEKAEKIIEKMRGKPLEELKDIHPRPEFLSRKARIEEVPKILLILGWETIDEAYRKFENSGRQGTPFDFIPEKKELQDILLTQALANLRNFSTEEEVAKRFPRLPRIARERYEFLSQKLQKIKESGK